MEQYTNDPGSTLNGGITNVATTLVVTSASSFPSTGTFRILIDGGEICKVTGVSGTTFTIVRGQEGTTGVSHLSGVSIDGIFTQASLNQILADRNIYDLYANLPAAGSAGRKFIPSDGGIVFYDDGTNWQGIGYSQKLVPLVNSAFSWLNQGSCTLVQTGTDWSMFVSGVATSVLACRYKAAPATPYTIKIKLTYTPVSNSSGGGFYAWVVGFLDSSSGKIHNYMLSWNTGAVESWSEKYNSFSSFNADYSALGHGRDLQPIPIWVYLKDDGTNRSVGCSYDGINFTQFDIQTRTDFLTPDSVFWGIRNDTTEGMGVTIHSWQETSP